MKRYNSISRRLVTRIFLSGIFVLSLSILDHNISRAQDNNSTVNQEIIPSETDLKTDAEIEKKNEQTQAWLAASPPPDGFDWIQLVSGEWLRGEFKALYEEELEFDSDELDFLVLDWENVKQVRGHQIFSVRFEGAINVIGRVQVTEDKVYVSDGDRTETFERSRLVNMVPGQPKERNYWSAKLSLGLDISEGNAQQVQFNSKGSAARRTSATRVKLDYLGNYTTSDSVDTEDNQRVNGVFDMLIAKKYYIRAVFAEYFRDPFQNINSRVTAGAGLGYHIIDTSKTSWEVNAGPAYQMTSFDSVEEGGDSSVSTPVFTGGTEFETELTRILDFIGSYSFNIMNEESGQYSHHAVATFETEITDRLDFDMSLVWDRIEKPTARSDTSVPEQDDFKLIFGVGVDF